MFCHQLVLNNKAFQKSILFLYTNPLVFATAFVREKSFKIPEK